ncbi:PPPDE putative peptidase domain-containing protein [Syncephalastrum racemosum]|uniref:PPPDE putative peptidase domain-containing protein n=1 Tax=Syncephalastrum racemosum TaxID=13706 RepID=A0A1X2HNS6_SYNRA|nr:PPPDE putative peptidase domain-containing protein [Syncephalastrum racemosum]
MIDRQTILIGYVDMTETEISQVLQAISQEFMGTSYNLLTRNCNHFTEELCRRLCNKSSPGWINRAAKLGAMFPCVIPDEWVEPPEFETDRKPK